MKTVLLWLLGLSCLCLLQPAALASEDAELDLKAMFIARFVQFTQ